MVVATRNASIIKSQLLALQRGLNVNLYIGSTDPLMLTVERDGRPHCVALYDYREHTFARYRAVSVDVDRLESLKAVALEQDIAPVHICLFADGYRGQIIRRGYPYLQKITPGQTLVYQLPGRFYVSMHRLFGPSPVARNITPWYLQ